MKSRTTLETVISVWVELCLRFSRCYFLWTGAELVHVFVLSASQPWWHHSLLFVFFSDLCYGDNQFNEAHSVVESCFWFSSHDEPNSGAHGSFCGWKHLVKWFVSSDGDLNLVLGLILEHHLLRQLAAWSESAVTSCCNFSKEVSLFADFYLLIVI